MTAISSTGGFAQIGTNPFLMVNSKFEDWVGSVAHVLQPSLGDDNYRGRLTHLYPMTLAYWLFIC